MMAWPRNSDKWMRKNAKQFRNFRKMEEKVKKL